MWRDRAGIAEALWYGAGPGAQLCRTALMPLEGVYRGVVALRGALLSGGTGVVSAGVPVLSVGNLSVGGTGKTPVASWLAGRLLARGARPGLVLRGYGDDEPAVHRMLQPEAIVEVNPDRVSGAEAARRAGATVVVLDDAMQHRRIARDLDVVLLSADRPWTTRCLPSGPLREPVSALRRAGLVLVTRKAASREAAAMLEQRVREVVGGAPIAHCALVLDGLVRVGDGPDPGWRPMSDLSGRRIVALSGIGNPSAWHAQLLAQGATIQPMVYPDHHRYDAADTGRIVAGVPHDHWVVCTLKDAVKLRTLWPRSGPALWYVSQRVDPGEDLAGIERALDRVWPDPFRERRQ